MCKYKRIFFEYFATLSVLRYIWIMNLLRLKELLEEREISIKDFAKKTGLSYTYCTELARGDKFPRADVLYNIATVLDVDIRDLFKSTKPENNTPEELISQAEKLLEELKSKI